LKFVNEFPVGWGGPRLGSAGSSEETSHSSGEEEEEAAVGGGAARRPGRKGGKGTRPQGGAGAVGSLRRATTAPVPDPSAAWHELTRGRSSFLDADDAAVGGRCEEGRREVDKMRRLRRQAPNRQAATPSHGPAVMRVVRVRPFTQKEKEMSDTSAVSFLLPDSNSENSGSAGGSLPSVVVLDKSTGSHTGKVRFQPHFNAIYPPFTPILTPLYPRLPPRHLHFTTILPSMLPSILPSILPPFTLLQVRNEYPVHMVQQAAISTLINAV